MSSLGNSHVEVAVTKNITATSTARPGTRLGYGKFQDYQGTTYLVEPDGRVWKRVASSGSDDLQWIGYDKVPKKSTLALKLYRLAFPFKLFPYKRHSPEDARNSHASKHEFRFSQETHCPKRRKPRQQRKVIW